MHVWNRDALKERIKVVTAEGKSDLYSAQLRLEKLESQITTEKQRFQVELKQAQEVTKEITIERDQLLSKIELLNNVKWNFLIAKRTTVSIVNITRSSHVMPYVNTTRMISIDRALLLRTKQRN